MNGVGAGGLSTSSDGAAAYFAGPHLADVTGRLAALPLQLLASSALLLHRWWLWLPSLARLRCPYCSDGLKMLLVLLLVSAALAEVILSPATFSCITLMPMKGEILVGTMEKTLKLGVFLKSALIETIFLPS